MPRDHRRELFVLTCPSLAKALSLRILLNGLIYILSFYSLSLLVDLRYSTRDLSRLLGLRPQLLKLLISAFQIMAMSIEFKDAETTKTGVSKFPQYRMRATTNVATATLVQSTRSVSSFNLFVLTIN